ALYNPQQRRPSAVLYGEEAGGVCCSRVAWTLWLLGYPDQALARNEEAVSLAQQLAHPYSSSLALVCASIFYAFRREVRAAQGHAEAAINLASEQGFPYWMALSSLLRGWALAQQAGQAQEGIAQITQGLLAIRATGAELWRPYWLMLLAEAHRI